MTDSSKSSSMPPSSPLGPLYFLLAVVLSVFMLLVSKAFAGEVRTVRLSDEKVAQISVSNRGTVLSFPVKPTRVILGKKGAFGIEYVENDLAVTPLGPGVRSHLFVYLYGRRFSFDLVGGNDLGAAIVLVRDLLDEPRKAPAPTANVKKSPSLAPPPSQTKSVPSTPNSFATKPGGRPHGKGGR